jgi:predicted ATP-dependent endonuclease of OLD family
LRARLHIINAEVAEGLFADAVVLVEGVSDRAAIIAAAALEGVDLEALGIAVVVADGKPNMDRPAAIFDHLRIPTFLVWDCDKQGDGTIKGGEQNRALQVLMGVRISEIVDAATKIASNFACFETKLETVIKAEIGAALYQQQLDLVKAKYGIDRSSDAEKTPSVMRELLVGAAAAGRRSPTLSGMVRAIQQLRNDRLAEEARAEGELGPAGQIDGD